MPHAYACCWTGYTILRMDYHKIKRFTYSLSCHPLMTGRGVRYLHMPQACIPIF